MALRKLPLIVNAENQQTSHGPARRLFARAEARRDRESRSDFDLSVQPWMDIDEMGSAVVAVTDGNAHAADRQAAEIAQKFWDTERILKSP